MPEILKDATAKGAHGADLDLAERVRGLITDIETRGEAAVREMSETFDDWSPEQLMQHANLGLEVATKALRREYSEPLVWQDSESALTDFKKLLQNKQLENGIKSICRRIEQMDAPISYHMPFFSGILIFFWQIRPA